MVKKEAREIGTVGEKRDKTAYANEGVQLPTAPLIPLNEVVVVESPPPPTTGNVNDFRPTTPGHSPGVGHSLQN